MVMFDDSYPTMANDDVKAEQIENRIRQVQRQGNLRDHYDELFELFDALHQINSSQLAQLSISRGCQPKEYITCAKVPSEESVEGVSELICEPTEEASLRTSESNTLAPADVVTQSGHPLNHQVSSPRYSSTSLVYNFVESEAHEEYIECEKEIEVCEVAGEVMAKESVTVIEYYDVLAAEYLNVENGEFVVDTVELNAFEAVENCAGALLSDVANLFDKKPIRNVNGDECLFNFRPLPTTRKEENEQLKLLRQGWRSHDLKNSVFVGDRRGFLLLVFDPGRRFSSWHGCLSRMFCSFLDGNLVMKSALFEELLKPGKRLMEMAAGADRKMIACTSQLGKVTLEIYSGTLQSLKNSTIAQHILLFVDSIYNYKGMGDAVMKIALGALQELADALRGGVATVRKLKGPIPPFTATTYYMQAYGAVQAYESHVRRNSNRRDNMKCNANLEDKVLLKGRVMLRPKPN